MFMVFLGSSVIIRFKTDNPGPWYVPEYNIQRTPNATFNWNGQVFALSYVHRFI